MPDSGIVSRGRQGAILRLGGRDEQVVVQAARRYLLIENEGYSGLVNSTFCYFYAQQNNAVLSNRNVTDRT